MFAVIFEVHPSPDQWDVYLRYAQMLKPELEQIDGFVDNIRYRSLTRDGWILSLSNWRDEKALVRWRTKAKHHDAQEKGRGGVMLDYHLRVGQLTQDTCLPQGHVLREQRLDETDVGRGTAVILIDAKRPPEWVKATEPQQVAEDLGVEPDSVHPVSWDVFEAVLTPGDVMLLTTWRDQIAAAAFEDGFALQPEARLRRVRVIRDYGMFDRREAPQYYPDVVDAKSVSE